MLGDQPPLTPPQLIYQRMLADDPIEAAEQAHGFLKDGSLEDYYDLILLNGLKLAAADLRLGHLDDERLDRILATVAELTSDLEAHDDVPPADVVSEESDSNLGALAAVEQAGVTVTSIANQWKLPRSILCIPGSTKLDEAVALVLAQILQRRGYGAAAERADALSISKFFSLDLSTASLICVCYVDRPSSAKIHYAVRRLAKKAAGTPVMLSFLGDEPGPQTEILHGAIVVRGPFKDVVEAVVDNGALSSAPSEPELRAPLISQRALRGNTATSSQVPAARH
jgi:hypothetical protein